MSQLTALKMATTLSEVAKLLEVKPAMLSYNLYIKGMALRYSKFDIPKRTGGTRTISAPLGDLKLIQKRLSELLQNCLQEIEEAKGFPVEGPGSDRISHGFKRKRTILTNAREHLRRRYVLNVDLSDFFGTINFGRVRGFFLKNNQFLLHSKVATVLAQIACHEGKLPQGSPCSPVISNLVAHVLDVRLVQLASSVGCIYTRYADDLTFSTNKKQFPTRIAKYTENQAHKWIAGKELTRLVKKNGFELNEAKTRMQYRDSRQDVTGLVVNRKVNVPRTYRHTVRAMVHRLFTTGRFSFEYKLKNNIGALVSTQVVGETEQLEGMLAYIDRVELYNRDLYKKNIPAYPHYAGRERLHRRFIFFDAFYNPEMPVVVCEGKTDNVYLLHAIHSLADKHPKLAVKDGAGKVSANIRIFNYFENRTGKILGMFGGSGDLNSFMKNYLADVETKFRAPLGAHPVIMLIDNDSGANDIYSSVSNIAKKKVTGNEPFIHVNSNLYIVPTPKNPGETTSKIEEFFDAATLDMPFEGKKFNMEKGKDTATQFGKVVFAYKIVKKNAETINFDGFIPLLKNIEAAIADHAGKKVATVISAPTKS